jgi:glutamate synthase (NADPH/NADH) small chain
VRPARLQIDADGKLIGLKTWKVLSIFDEEKPLRPKIRRIRRHHPCLRHGRRGHRPNADMSLLGDSTHRGLEWNRGRIQIDRNGRTSEPWLWSAGDCVKGPDVVNAVADGHRVAASIHQAVTNHPQVGDRHD